MRVKVLPQAGRSIDVELEDGAVVEEALDESEFDSAGLEIHVNGRGAQLNTRLQNGDVVSLHGKVEGS